MLKFNPRRVFALRGIDNALTFMMNNGFTRSTASTILNMNTSAAKQQHVERLCVLLSCTPNDLYEWKPDSRVLITKDHPLQSLTRIHFKDPLEFLKEIPLERLNALFTTA